MGSFKNNNKLMHSSGGHRKRPGGSIGKDPWWRIIFMKKILLLLIIPIGVFAKPMYITFLWHMHQPVYIPYYDAFTIVNNNGAPGGPYFSFSLSDMWSSKHGPYTTWPTDAIEYGLDMPHLGAQVNLSGSLIESLNNLENNNWNGGFYSGWKNRFNQGRSYLTVLNNPRLDIVVFPYHHPILPLIWRGDMEMQIACDKYMDSTNFSGVSKGLFPTETAFSERIIPALVSQGIKWVIVDNIHISRTLRDYPWNGGSGVVEPNLADQQNGYLSSKPHSGWVQLNNVWAPEKVAAGFAYRPHYAIFIDPETGDTSKIIVVPAACYAGNEDARGGFGALQYEQVFSQIEPYNTDTLHPILILLHHDGENYGAGVESYYHSNFSNYCQWLRDNPTRFAGTTIEDYLEMYPPDPSDIIHVENGGWVGSGCLDPEFKKWLGDGFSGYSPDWNSWAVITAAHNWVWTADSILPYSSIPDIVNNSGNLTSKAFHYYLVSQTSDYEYWEGSSDEEIWNSNATRACNLAIDQIRDVVQSGNDVVGPSIFVPQREPYNPGGTEFGQTMSSDFQVWTFIYDIHGIKSAYILYRVDDDTTVDYENCVYSTGQWDTVHMDSETWNSQTDPLPYYKAKRYYGYIRGLKDCLVDYYVEAIDSLGNKSRSDIMHVWVGSGGGSGSSTVEWSPLNPATTDTIRIIVHSSLSGWLHWGVNSWRLPDSTYWPPGSSVWQDSSSIESPLLQGDGYYYIDIGPFSNGDVSVVDFAIHFSDDTWDNNHGDNYHIVISGGGSPYVMDGNLDAVAESIATNSGHHLYAHFNGSELYVATEPASNYDHFILLAFNPGSLVNHPWAKNGRVAQWDAYLGNEQSNGWCGWFDVSDSISSRCASGSVLEGVINLRDEFGFIPDSIFIAAAGYETQDSGNLVWQVPEALGSFPQDIEPTEFKKFKLTTTGISESENKTGASVFITKTLFSDWTDIIINSADKNENFYIDIFDIFGRIIRRDKVCYPYRYRWYGNGSDGKRVKNGIYFISIKSRKRHIVKKVIIIR